MVQSRRGRSVNVLLVEDHEKLRKAGGRGLTKAGYSVATARSGREALDLVRARAPDAMDWRGFPTTLPEFQRVFPDEAACARYLEALRWPDGFTCPKCGRHGEPYRFNTRSSVVLRCRHCRDKGNISLTAGTVMQGTHMPLSTWFWAAYLMSTQTPGRSAVQFQRQLGLTRSQTAFQILHKLRGGMVRPERDAIGGEHPVTVDECLLSLPA